MFLCFWYKGSPLAEALLSEPVVRLGDACVKKDGSNAERNNHRAIPDGSIEACLNLRWKTARKGINNNSAGRLRSKLPRRHQQHEM